MGGFFFYFDWECQNWPLDHLFPPSTLVSACDSFKSQPRLWNQLFLRAFNQNRTNRLSNWPIWASGRLSNELESFRIHRQADFFTLYCFHGEWENTAKFPFVSSIHSTYECKKNEPWSFHLGHWPDFTHTHTRLQLICVLRDLFLNEIVKLYEKGEEEESFYEANERSSKSSAKKRWNELNGFIAVKKKKLCKKTKVTITLFSLSPVLNAVAPFFKDHNSFVKTSLFDNNLTVSK